MKEFMQKLLSALKHFFLKLSIRLHVGAKVRIGNEEQEDTSTHEDE